METVLERFVINYDETIFTNYLGGKKINVKIGCRHTETIADSSKSSIPVLFTAVNDGMLLL